MNERLHCVYEFAQKAIDELNGFVPGLGVLKATVEFSEQSDYCIFEISLRLSERSKKTCYSFFTNIYWRRGVPDDEHSAVAVWVDQENGRRRAFESRQEELRRKAWLIVTRLRDFVKKELCMKDCSVDVYVGEED